MYASTAGKTAVLFLFVFLLLSSIAYADTLVYEQRHGSHTGFDLNGHSSIDNPVVSLQEISSCSSGDHSNLDGYIGRFVYTGDQRILTFRNMGAIPQGESPDAFYNTWAGYHTPYTHLIDTSSWRQVFFSARVKGFRHNGETVDIDGHNTLIVSPFDSLLLPGGAGDENVTPGQSGFDAAGVGGVYDGSNEFIYAYPYRYLYVDFSLIRTDRSNNLGSSKFFKNLFVNQYGWYKNYYKKYLKGQIVFYEEVITVTGESISLVISLEGYQIAKYSSDRRQQSLSECSYRSDPYHS
ncbi:MAG: hypothetical protein JXK93_00435 [Sphaerochaetaceae bacterium]|nr:hypothetical protein [Sphaerochaetaceae bacterium]